MAVVLSVNLGSARPTRHSDVYVTGIDKRPVEGRVMVADPGPKGDGGAGLAGDAICDTRHHGGSDQAVYAYAREDLDWWERELQRQLRSGMFGENLTTRGLDVSNAHIGERWHVGESCVLEVTSPRIPCRTFAGWLEEQRWVKRFMQHGAPGAYLRVITPGPVQAGDAVTVVAKPDHEVTIGFMFRALTTEKRLQPRLAVAGDALDIDTKRKVLGTPA